MAETATCFPKSALLPCPGTPIDYISQPPLQLGVVMWLRCSQWKEGGRHRCHLQSWPYRFTLLFFHAQTPFCWPEWKSCVILDEVAQLSLTWSLHKWVEQTPPKNKKNKKKHIITWNLPQLSLLYSYEWETNFCEEPLHVWVNFLHQSHPNYGKILADLPWPILEKTQTHTHT